ncbi:MAG TPA: hypothetical protein QGF58_14320 [Myxococcota bacterium]|nr:hypothetical protein [Myxococcota bacterium]
MIWLLACVPSVEVAPERAARSYCQRAEDCSLLQEGERKETCEPNTTEAFEALWDESVCEEGFDRKPYKACETLIATWDCDDISAGWTDIGETCSARTVCK